MENKKSLIAKINAAVIDVGGKLKADKQNQDQHYSYISADKALSVIGQALSSSGVAVIPNITENTIEVFEYEDNYGKKKRRFDAAVTFLMLLSDGESDLTLTWRGAGSDFSTPDKALYKAITSGHKYFLLKLLCIGEGNEDSEHEEPEKTAPLAQAKPAAKPNGNGHVPEPPPDPPSMAEAGQALGGVVTEQETVIPASRPYPAPALKKAIEKKAATHKVNGKPCSDGLRGLMVGTLEGLFSGDAETKANKRHQLCVYLTGGGSSRVMPPEYVNAIMDWAQNDNAMASKEAEAVVVGMSVNAGQKSML